jgi:hypothetical protein
LGLNWIGIWQIREFTVTKLRTEGPLKFPLSYGRIQMLKFQRTILGVLILMAGGAQASPRVALGVGYPDLRARVGLSEKVDAEGKFAFSEGVQVYSARLYWNFVDLGPLKFTAGAEGGWLKFDGVETLSGSGSVAGGFVGLEYPFAKRFRLSLDAGPAWMQASAEGQTFASTDIVYNTALYFYLY